MATAAAEVCIAYVVGHNEDDAGFACPASSLGGGRVRSLKIVQSSRIMTERITCSFFMGPLP